MRYTSPDQALTLSSPPPIPISVVRDNLKRRARCLDRALRLPLLIPGLLPGASGSWGVIRSRMKLQEGSCGVTGTFRDFARGRLLGDAEQQADHQITQEQPAELLGESGRTALERSGRLSSCHDFTQGSTPR